jgi:hypothetical protein
MIALEKSPLLPLFQRGILHDETTPLFEKEGQGEILNKSYAM